MSPVILLHVAATLFMTGVIWTVQIVHYPMMALVRDAFDDCQRFHLARMTFVVGPAMLLEGVTGALLVWERPTPLLIAASALLPLIWLSTVLVQVPRHNRLASGFHARTHFELVATNWFRTAAWSLRSVCLLAYVWLQ